MLQANILGTTLGILLARSITKADRRRLELLRLYRPVDSLPLNSSTGHYPSDEEEEEDTLAEAEEGRRTNREMQEGLGRVEARLEAGSGGPIRSSAPKTARRAEANPWDSGEEIFGIGDDELEEDDRK